MYMDDYDHTPIYGDDYIDMYMHFITPKPRIISKFSLNQTSNHVVKKIFRPTILSDGCIDLIIQGTENDMTILGSHQNRYKSFDFSELRNIIITILKNKKFGQYAIYGNFISLINSNIDTINFGSFSIELMLKNIRAEIKLVKNIIMKMELKTYRYHVDKEKPEYISTHQISKILKGNKQTNKNINQPSEMGIRKRYNACVKC